MEEFKIEGDYIELTKLVKAAGWCDTGGMAKHLIADGLVQVDGKTELRKRCKIKRGQKVSFQQYTVSLV